MSLFDPAVQLAPGPRGPAHLLARSAALFGDMVAARRTRAAAHPASRTTDEALAALTTAVDRIPAELPGLVGALAMRGAVFGSHGVAA